jgi:NAD(P)-dependent dehydrogenase (short-subunit alcohol dehydrogenase family)
MDFDSDTVILPTLKIGDGEDATVNRPKASLESLFSLRGHVGFVTGASSGLGVECATVLALAGADVALAARRTERIEKLASELASTYRVRTAAVPLDVTDDAAIDAALESVRQKLGLVDILVNNAGISPTGRAETLPRAIWDAAIATNLTAPMMLAQRVARALIEAHRPGRIINMVSIYATVASSIYRLSAYTAAKAGLLNLTRQLAVEWAPYGILVNALAPGWIPTEATEPGLAISSNRERIERATPIRRLGRPEEIRGAVVFLVSPASSYVTGSMVAVDGGYDAW